VLKRDPGPAQGSLAPPSVDFVRTGVLGLVGTATGRFAQGQGLSKPGLLGPSAKVSTMPGATQPFGLSVTLPSIRQRDFSM